MSARAGRNAAAPLAAAIASLCIAGCAAMGTPAQAPGGPGTARTPAGERPTPQAAMDLLGPGASSRADVAAALGPAIVIPFDSGYQVWVYRWPGADGSPRAATELVLLFSPQGLLAKSRLRPGYPP